MATDQQSQVLDKFIIVRRILSTALVVVNAHEERIKSPMTPLQLSETALMMQQTSQQLATAKQWVDDAYVLLVAVGANPGQFTLPESGQVEMFKEDEDGEEGLSEL